MILENRFSEKKLLRPYDLLLFVFFGHLHLESFARFFFHFFNSPGVVLDVRRVVFVSSGVIFIFFFLSLGCFGDRPKREVFGKLLEGPYDLLSVGVFGASGF